jgi:hypothetical protein
VIAARTKEDNELSDAGRNTEKQIRTRTQQILFIVTPLIMSIDGSAGLRISQDTSMVHEWCSTRVGRFVEFDNHPLDLEEVALERVEEASGLKMLRRGTAKKSEKKNQIKQKRDEDDTQCRKG